jgi:hypothetical protein
MDDEKICRLLTGTSTRTEVEILVKEAESNEDFVWEREKTPTQNRISAAV